MAADRKAGRPAYLNWFQFGYCWFGIILFTAGLGIGKLELERYYVGVCVLVGVALFHLRGSRKSPGRLGDGFYDGGCHGGSDDGGSLCALQICGEECFADQ